MAMRLRKIHGNSQELRHRHSLNGFCFAHDHAGRLIGDHECAAVTRIKTKPDTNIVAEIPLPAFASSLFATMLRRGLAKAHWYRCERHRASSCSSSVRRSEFAVRCLAAAYRPPLSETGVEVEETSGNPWRLFRSDASRDTPTAEKKRRGAWKRASAPSLRPTDWRTLHGRSTLRAVGSLPGRRLQCIVNS